MRKWLALAALAALFGLIGLAPSTSSVRAASTTVFVPTTAGATSSGGAGPLDSGVFVPGGAVVVVTATGQATACFGCGGATGPNGAGLPNGCVDSPHPDFPCTAPDLPAYSLIAQFGSTGPWHFVGAGPTALRAPAGGAELFFAYNDGYYPDNDAQHDGGYTATIVTDTQAPSVTLSATAPPNGQNGFYTSSPVMLTLNADDTSTGNSWITSLNCGAGNTVTPTSGASTPHEVASIAVSGDGTHAVTCTATDAAGNVGTSNTLTVKIDTQAPGCTVSVSPSVIWPPNHQLVTITATVQVTDAGSGSAGFTLVSVTSNEPANALGDGNTSSDIQGWNVGTADTSGQVRAERSGSGTGRIYTLTYQGTDAAGNRSAPCTATVTVSHDQGR